ncbi:alpha/beta hydrolase [Alphaproteobacteria bacterium KMM 3653]|uniref:Alpha/beta hydrolase n=1 Tax=Harenicola maris TaxID=2841044 RepID=A0AAP2G2Z8_9RHOB|nr:alpha/beta hydrolase [Harenicola maris]
MSVQLTVVKALSRWTMKPVLTHSLNIPRIRKWFRYCVEPFFFSPRGFWKRPANLASGVSGLWVGAGKGTHPDPLQTGVILYFHGGGFVFGSPGSHARMVADLAMRCDMAGFVANYALAPEHPFPAAHNDALAAYEALLGMGVPADKIVIGGDSAGGNIALVLLSQILAKGLPRPRATLALCPVTDLTYSGASITENAKSDVFLPASQIPVLMDHYLGKHPANDPLASPLFADFTGAPPVLIHATDIEILRDDALRMDKALTAQGVDSTLQITPKAMHVWHLMRGVVPEANAALDQIADWLRPR